MNKKKLGIAFYAAGTIATVAPTFDAQADHLQPFRPDDHEHPETPEPSGPLRAFAATAVSSSVAPSVSYPDLQAILESLRRERL